MPNITFESLEAIPEGLKDFAKQVDGKFIVNVVAETKLAEFRDNNTRISGERDAAMGVLGKLKPVIGELDVDAFIARHTELAATAQQVADGKLKATGDIEAEVNNRVTVMKTGFEQQLSDAQRARAAAEQSAAEANQRFNRSIVDRAVSAAVVDEKSGALPGALNDILTRAYGVFKVVDGKVVAKDGDAVIYGADGATPMSPMEWLGKLRGEASYFFKNSSGGGAAGGTGQAGVGGTGLSQADFRKLSPEAKLRLAHQQKSKK